jgi:hypothetical protein
VLFMANSLARRRPEKLRKTERKKSGPWRLKAIRV